MPQYVKDVMTPTVTSVRPDASLVEAAQLMRAQDIGGVFVALHGELLGVLTDRDITVRAVADGVDPLTVSCHLMCTPDPVTIGPDQEVTEAAALMRRHEVRRLPVVRSGRPVGVVSMRDLERDRTPT